MQLTKFSLLTTISAIIRKYKGKYCYASQERFLELLEEIHGIKIKVRALNKHLHDLRAEGLIISRKRIRREEDGTLCLETSATCITIAGYELLIREGAEWCKGILYQLKKKYMSWFDRKKEPQKTPGKPGNTGVITDSLKKKINEAINKKTSLYDHLMQNKS